MNEGARISLDQPLHGAAMVKRNAERTQRHKQCAKCHGKIRQTMAGFSDLGNEFGFGYHEFMVAEGR